MGLPSEYLQKQLPGKKTPLVNLTRRELDTHDKFRYVASNPRFLDVFMLCAGPTAPWPTNPAAKLLLEF